MAAKIISIWDFTIIKLAIRESFLKLSPRNQIRNPVMFTVYISSLFTSFLFIHAWFYDASAHALFVFSITLWLWVTLLFANFAEAMAEGRGKAQAHALRKSRREIQAKKLAKADRHAKVTLMKSDDLRAGDIVLV